MDGRNILTNFLMRFPGWSRRFLSAKPMGGSKWALES